MKENLVSLIDLATIAMEAKYTKSIKGELQTFNEVWNDANLDSQRK